jgi:hypothetical protein
VAGLALVALWAVAEAVLFFIVADVPIMALALHKGWRAGLTTSLVAAVFAALGGVALAMWAASDPAGSRTAVLAVPGISAAMMDTAATAYAQDGFLAMLWGSFSGVPYKLYAHAGGVAGSNLALFALASIAARLPRFALIALAAGMAGPWLRTRLSPPVLWTIFAGAWIAFYTGYFLAHPG